MDHTFFTRLGEKPSTFPMHSIGVEGEESRSNIPGLGIVSDPRTQGSATQKTNPRARTKGHSPPPTGQSGALGSHFSEGAALPAERSVRQVHLNQPGESQAVRGLNTYLQATETRPLPPRAGNEVGQGGHTPQGLPGPGMKLGREDTHSEKAK